MEKIKKFLEIDLGYDHGFGDKEYYKHGTGYGFGDGYNSDSGYGYGCGCGDGFGDGYGHGDNRDIITFNGNKVHVIDGIATVIEKVHLNLAKGYIIRGDLTTRPCFIAKGDNKFAHGATASEARKALQDKIFEDMDTEQKIEMFIKEFKPDIKYPAKSFYEWHHKLTGSCEFGRNAFVKNHNIDMNGEYTVSEFIKYTRDAYGGDVIETLAEHYNV